VLVFWDLHYITLYVMRRQALSRSYGRFIAEFLEEQSPVRLGLLDLTTCVGFGTVSFLLSLEAFLGSPLYQILFGVPQSFRIT